LPQATIITAIPRHSIDIDLRSAADAVLDRSLHHAYKIEMKGESIKNSE
jgi:hypothetical protein